MIKLAFYPKTPLPLRLYMICKNSDKQCIIIPHLSSSTNLVSNHNTCTGIITHISRLILQIILTVSKFQYISMINYRQLAFQV